MADTESIGGVSVAITGDASGLGPAFTAAQSQAQAAGTAIASSFNTAAASSNQLTSEINRLILAIQQEGAASDLAMQRNLAMSRSLTQFGQAAGGAHVNTRFLVFGLKDLAEGRGTFAMAELVNVVSRLGPVFIGAAAGLAVMAIPLLSAIIKTKELKDAEKELADATQASDDAFAHTERTLTELTVKEVTTSGGVVLGKNAEITAMQQRLARIKTDIQDAADKIPEIAAAGAGSIKNYVPIISESHSQATIDKIKAQGQVVKDLAEHYRELQGQIDAATGKDLPRLRAQQSGALSAAQVALREEQLKHQSELNKVYSDEEITQARDAANQRIAAMTGEYDRVVATGVAEVEEAKARQRAITNALADEIPPRIALARAAGAAEQAGKSRPEQERIGVQTQTKVEGIQAGADKQTTDAQANVVAAQQKAAVSLIELNERLTATLRAGSLSAYEDILKTAREVTSEQQKQITTMTEELLREQEGRAAIAQASGKAQGEVAAAQLKANYQLQGVHTLQEEISYRQQLAAIQEREYTAELGSLAAKLKAAQALSDEEGKAEGVLAVQREIVALSGKAQAANVTSAGQIGALQNQQDFRVSADQDLKAALMQLPNTLGNALAKGLFDHGKGQSIGKDVGQAAKGAGQQLSGKLISDGLSHLGAYIIKQTGLQAAFNALFPTVQTGQTAAITTAIAAGDTAIVASQVAGSAATVAALAIGNALLTAIFLKPSVLGTTFASGTDSAPGGLSLVGEKGPEIMYVPRGAQVIPNHKIKGYADGVGYSSSVSSSSSQSYGDMHFHAHGMSNPDQFIDHVMRKLPDRLKVRSSSFSPYSK